MRVLFMGTPEIGSYVLKALVDLNVDIIGVVCQPDKQKDRKNNYVYSSVKKMALEYKFNIYQPDKIKDITNKIFELNPDIIITCAYGQFLNNEILSIPKYGCINVHASLLPKLRGGAPIHWAIINQEKKTGVSLMDMVSQMDAGDVYIQYECNIEENETYDKLYLKLCQLAYSIVYDNLNKLIANKLVKTKQDESKVSYGYIIKKEQAIINFNQNINEVDAWIRGLSFKPTAIWRYKDQNIKIIEWEKTNIVSKFSPANISSINRTGIYICTNDYDILIKKIQMPNKNPCYISNIINGNNIFEVFKNENK